MTLQPLSVTQVDVIGELIDAGRIGAVPSDLIRAGIFLAQAREAIDDLPNLTRAQNVYNLAYDACHDVGEALLAAYGYRTANGPGQHEALGRVLRTILDTPPGDAAARRFDRLRRARNQQRYDARPVGSADADAASAAARDLFAGARARGLTESGAHAPDGER